MFKGNNLFVLIFLSIFFVMCKKAENETILKGETSILIDESLAQVVDDQVMIFEDKYDAKLKMLTKSEAELIIALTSKKADIAVMARDLTLYEYKIFEQKKIKPKVTKFAKDAIVFICKKNAVDSLIDLKTVVDFMKGNKNSNFKGIVFDNPNSSIARYIKKLAKVEKLPSQGVYSFQNSQEAIQFVANNDDMIGVVGLNWLTQPLPAIEKYINEITVLSVKGEAGNKYYLPNQNNLAENTYPLARDLYIVNVQGFSGLGMGFASFVSGDIGQRIILKSGLLPITMPGRKINIRKQIIENEN